MELTGTPTHQIGNRTYIAFTDENGVDVFEGGRSVYTAEWLADPQAIVAAVAVEIAAKVPTPQRRPPDDPSPVTMKQAEIETKLEEVAEKKRQDQEAREAAAAAVTENAEPSR